MNIMPQNDQKSPAPISLSDYLLITAIMALMGAFFWAIRGTGGFGGESGGMLAGLGWAALWNAFSRWDGSAHRRPYGSGWMLLAITLGIAVGGLTGYGVYIAWLQGKFYLDYPNGLRAVAPWTGYAMLFGCGLHWGGIAGAFMAWCAPQKKLTGLDWIVRIAFGCAGAFAAWIFVRSFPQLFLPFYAEGLYQVPENKTCLRALDSIQTIAPHVGMFLGFLAFEGMRRDTRAVALMLVMALGFAIPFTLGGYWHTFENASIKLPWWKNWEMSIGLGGGLAFGIAFYLFNRPSINTLPRYVTPKERIWGSAVPLWMGFLTICGGAFEGLRDLHQLNADAQLRIAVTLVYFVPATVLFIAWSMRVRRKTAASQIPDATAPIPVNILMAILLLIAIVGFAISIPQEITLANAYLLTLYALYILLSLVCLGTLRFRSRRTP